MDGHDEASAGEGSVLFQSLKDLIPISSARRRSLYDVDASSDGGEGHVVTELRTARMIALTVVLFGAQLVWAVEQSYGTPYLVSLSLSRESVALVWMCGPVSGLIMQPLMGAWSDASRSRFRRRKYIVGSTIVVCITLLLVAYSRETAGVIVDSLSLGTVGQWDPARPEQVRKTALAIAIPSFVLVDFGLNALQASSRALILDTARHGQHVRANAWQGRMTHAANVLGFSLGILDLAHTPALNWLPGGQFARLCDIAVLLLVVCTAITVFFQKEEEPLPWAQEPEATVFVRFKQAFSDVGDAIATLPRPIRRLCWAQMLSWSGWFAFLFYATFWVGQHWSKDHPEATNADAAQLAERVGSFAMLWFALVALLAGTILPLIESLGISRWGRQRGTLTRLVLSKLTPRTIWTVAQLLFGGLMLSTLLVKTASQASVVVALVGVSWAVSCWVPFALVMQFIHEIEPMRPDLEDEDDPSAKITDRFSSATPPVSPFATKFKRASLSSLPSTSAATAQDREVRALTDCTPLLTREEKRPRGATFLGVHNCAITIPQLLTSIVASIVFRSTNNSGKHSTKDLSRLFAYGGAMALLSAIATRAIQPSSSELVWKEELLEGDA